AAKIVKQAILKELRELKKIPAEKLIESRLEKYAGMGFFDEPAK
ncbi:MAG: acetyl-CoA carboxylase carboxyl transferase subunit alpha, partial [Calditrichaeota bacterium]